jgi:HD-GYP domain-containing protein (c-di-GMP phosphodiesterase class II)
MSSHRPYRPALGLAVALDELQANSGRLYDSDAVDACVRLYSFNALPLTGSTR